MPLENGSATRCVAGSIATLRCRRPRRREQLLERRRPGRVADREHLLDSRCRGSLERALGELRHGDEEARARAAQLERGLVGVVERVDRRIRPARLRDAVERNGVLGHVGREDPHPLTRPEPPRDEPGRAAVDAVRQLGVADRGAADRIDDRRPPTARRGAAEHEVGERRVGHRARRDAGCGSPSAATTLRAKWHSRRVSFGQVALAASVIWPVPRAPVR